MFVSIEVLIGLAFVYLILALIVTALTEWVSSALRLRARNLRNAVRQMLDPVGQTTTADAFYAHRRIQALSEGAKKPSYIPSKTFAEVLLDLTTRGQNKVDAEKVPLLGGPAASSLDIEERFLDTMNRASGWYKRKAIVISVFWAAVVVISANADTLDIADRLWSSPSIRQAIVAQAQARVALGRPRAIEDATYPNREDPVPSDTEESSEQEKESNQISDADRKALESLVGWAAEYKGINAPYCAALQKDRDNACRERGDETACGAILEKIAAEPRCELVQGALKPTVTFPGRTMLFSVMWPLVFGHLLGWMLSIAAVSLGAPFWFDTLSRFVNLRGSGPIEQPKNKGDTKTEKKDSVEQNKADSTPEKKS
jgi:hypothetical protein